MELWICIALWLINVTGSFARISDREMIQKLFVNYDPNVRPVRNASHPVKATIDIVLQQVVDLDEKNQILLTSLLIQLNWYDEILDKTVQHLQKTMDWNTDNVPRVESDLCEQTMECDETSFVILSDRIWTPDLYVYNNAADGKNGMLRVDESRLRVSKRGKVTWNLPVTVQSLCNVDVLYFPFDHQICDVRIGSWMYDRTQFQLSLGAHSDDLNAILDGIMENVELGIPEVKFLTRDRVTLDGLVFSEVVLRIHIKRRALFYGYTVIAPSIMLCVLTIFSFWLPSGNAKKIDIGLTVFLFLYFLQVLIAENTPESNSTPLIGTFLTMVMTLNSLSLICATWVLYLHVQSKKSPCPAPPHMLWIITSRIFGKITRTPYSLEQERLYTALHAKSDGAQVNPTQSNAEDKPVRDKTASDVQVVHWLYIATVADRLLFQIYLCVTLACVFIFLIYAPISYDVKI